MDLFLKVIEQLLDEWPALQVAIDNGMGGCYAREKKEWMSKVIQDFFRQNQGLQPNEVGDYIDEIMNNEFDTIIQDGSLQLLSNLLCKFYKFCDDEKYDEVNRMLEERRKFNANKTTEIPLIAPMNSLAIDHRNSNQQSIDEHSIETNSFEDRNFEGTKQPTNHKDDDGWTVVQRKKR